MKHDFIIVDVSSSVYSDEMDNVSSVNDLVSDLISELKSKDAEDIRVITYSDKAALYWSSSKNTIFTDMSADLFKGRSNLGMAYDFIADIVRKENISLSDCSLVLISDGEATDNYKKKLLLLDPKKESYRVSVSLGNVHITTEKHVIEDEFAYVNFNSDRVAFIDRVGNFH